MSKKFQEIDNAPSLTSMGYFVGVQDNGDGTFSDYRYSVSQLFEYFSIQLKKKITVTENGNTVQDSFFSNPISEIVAGGQTYIIDENFTQEGDIITGIDISFYYGQKIVAKVDSKSNKRIVSDVTGYDLSNSFFSASISEIITGGQTYIVDEDFTQNENTITAINFSFFIGQILIAKI